MRIIFKKLLVIFVASMLVFGCATVAFATDDLEILPPDGYTKGDVNLDSKIDIKDVILVLKHTIGNISLTDEQYLLADIDSNGEVNVKDAICIQKIILNIDNPVEEPTIPNEYVEDDEPIALPFVPAI